MKSYTFKAYIADIQYSEPVVVMVDQQNVAMAYIIGTSSGKQLISQGLKKKSPIVSCIKLSSHFSGRSKQTAEHIRMKRNGVYPVTLAQAGISQFEELPADFNTELCFSTIRTRFRKVLGGIGCNITYVIPQPKIPTIVPRLPSPEPEKKSPAKQGAYEGMLSSLKIEPDQIVTTEKCSESKNLDDFLPDSQLNVKSEKIAITHERVETFESNSDTAIHKQIESKNIVRAPTVKYDLTDVIFPVKELKQLFELIINNNAINIGALLTKNPHLTMMSDSNGLNALHIASVYGNQPVVNFLLTGLDNLNMHVIHVDKSGETVLDKTIRSGHIGLLDYYLDNYQWEPDTLKSGLAICLDTQYSNNFEHQQIAQILKTKMTIPSVNLI